MFDNILAVYNEKQGVKHLQAIAKVRTALKGRNYHAVEIINLKESDFHGIDLAITIGGDGTFTRAANYLDSAPILGVNSEPEASEGALTSILESELSSLSQILEGKFKIIQRQRARVTRNGKELREKAVNDVYVGAASQFHTSRYILTFEGKSEEQRSSGVIIATGSGSTAWYKSAGGTPFPFSEKVLKFLVREPYFGERVYKPAILKGEIKKGRKVAFQSTRNSGGIIALDNTTYDFNTGDAVEVELSGSPLNVILK